MLRRLGRRTSISILAWILGLTLTATASAASPRLMVLQLRDVPSGMAQALDRHIGVVQVKRDQGSVPHGFLTGWESEFKADNPIGGVADIDSSVSLYDSASDAHKSVLMSYRRVATGHPPGYSRFTRLSVGAPLGDEARMYVSKGHSSGIALTIYALVWRSGMAKASVIIGGVTGTIKPTAAVRLAKKQQARMR